MGRRLRKVLLYWRTARHLKASQIVWRIRYRMANGKTRGYSVPQLLPPCDSTAREGLRGFAGHWTSAAPPENGRTAEFIRGRFTFLNKTIQSSHPRWRGLDVPKLWAYNLHYFDFARDVALGYPDPASAEAKQVREWMLDWIDRNANFEPVAWDAFPLSVRLMNWSLILALYGWDDFRLLESVHLQLDYLAKHPEYDLRGNHLLKNAAALTVAGTLVNSTHRKAGLALLKKEARAQFLADGGHVERSPMYHGQALLDLLLARAVLETNPDWLAEATQRGVAFLHGLAHGDGRCPQFNDGAVEEAPTPATVLALSHKYYWGVPVPSGSVAFKKSGFYRMAPGGGAGLLFVKAGDSTVNHQPGHAHSDLLSFEYSLGNHRVLVNSGTHGYARSPYRDHCRSTAAHNTVRINGQEQLEHWSTFRVGRRIHGAASKWDASVPSLRASHQTIQGPRHERSVTWDARGWWRIVDAVSGRGALAVESFLHLHPDCAVAPLDTKLPVRLSAAYRVSAGGAAVTLLVAGGERVALVRASEGNPQGWYFPRFGSALPAAAVVLEAQGSDALRLGAALVPGNGNPADAAADLIQALTEDRERA